jgi:hypothetical protein
MPEIPRAAMFPLPREAVSNLDEHSRAALRTWLAMFRKFAASVGEYAE